jgi:sulfur-oxidizing protein SoxY
MRRRVFLRLASAGLVEAAGASRLAMGGSQADREHRIELDVPILSEEPAAVPIRVGVVEHPMDPDHYIRSVEVTLDRDPVPAKGKFLFSPGNGRAWVGYQMRSGTGGLVKAVATCTRHGEFQATREVRVVDGGCSTPPERGARERAGSPELRLPRSVKAGEPFEVRARVIHGSYTGLAVKQGRFVRELPEYYVKQMTVWLDDQRVSEFQMTSAVSPNPLIRFPLRVTRSATLRVEFVNSEGQRWDVSQPIRV